LPASQTVSEEEMPFVKPLQYNSFLQLAQKSWLWNVETEGNSISSIIKAIFAFSGRPAEA
jgi:hypothetical protein